MEVNGNRNIFGGVWGQYEDTCFECGTKFIKWGPVDESGKGLIFGGTCPKCQIAADVAYKKSVAENYKAFQVTYELEDAGVPGSNIDNRFKNYTPFTKTQQDAATSAACFLDSHSLLFSMIGTCGLGKTHLAVSIMAEFIERRIKDGGRKKAVYITEGRLIDEFKAGFNRAPKTGTLSESQVMEKYEQIGLLVIDEMGRNNDSDYTVQKIQDLLQSRIQNPMVKTVICGNMTSKKFQEHLGEAVRSRLNEVDLGGRKATLFFMDGTDYRSKGQPAS